MCVCVLFVCLFLIQFPATVMYILVFILFSYPIKIRLRYEVLPVTYRESLPTASIQPFDHKQLISEFTVVEIINGY